MDEYYSVIQFLPEPLRTELKAMPPERAACVQEIRLRAGQAVQFTVGGAWQPAQQAAAVWGWRVCVARRALPILHLSISALRARCPVSCRPSFAARWMP